MDGASVGFAVVGLVGDLYHFIKYLKEVKGAVDNIDEDIGGLVKELTGLHAVCESIQQHHDEAQRVSSQDPGLSAAWDAIKTPLGELRSAVGKFAGEVRKVYGDDPKKQNWLDGIKKSHRIREMSPKLKVLRTAVSNNMEIMQMYLQRANSTKQDSVHRDITLLLANMEHLKQSISISRASQRTGKTNRYFYIPKNVESHYIGREGESKALARAFWHDAQGQHQQQRRYVVFGVGGSGKTQFCCKYAQDFRQRYWGVFHVDARSHDQLQQTLSKNVASVAGVDLKHDAALHWLAKQDEDWLLIFDNADDPNIDLHQYFPSGERGHVLINTRNQNCTFDNVGSVEFLGMQPHEASVLLLSTAGYPASALPTYSTVVGEITHELGYLALAIVVAGSAVRQGVCRLQGYLKYFDEMWKRRRSRKGASHSQESTEMQREGRVEATFDMSFEAIRSQDDVSARDALELLRTFAFLHCNNIHYDFLKRCAEGARKEQANAEVEKEANATSSGSWSEYVSQALLWLHDIPQRHSVSTILPGVLREGRMTGRLDETRLRTAMKYLRSYSFASYDQETDSWSMHPLVQRWAREGYMYNVGEQHVWCDAASTIVSGCIIFGDNSTDIEKLMRDLLPHVDEVQKLKDALAKRIMDNRLGRNKWYPVFDWGIKRKMLLTLAKFSVVYVSAGLYEKAEGLQRIVQRATVSNLGYRHPSTRRITIAWAGTLWALSRADDSAKVLEELLDNCNQVCGPNHRDTYIVSVKLAVARLQQGRVPEARALCDTATPGLEKVCGPDHEETLDAVNISATTTLLLGTPGAVSEAQHLYRRTWQIRERTLGCNHVKTLDSRQLYYSSSFWHGTKSEHEQAQTGLEEIVSILKVKLGRQHMLTLLAMLYLARVKVELRDFDGAQDLFDYGLPIAEMSLEEGHMAVLFCRYHIGRMRVRQGRWQEARSLLTETCARQRVALQGWGRYHYDRIGTLLELARVHHELDQDDECDEVVMEALAGFDRVTTSEHPWKRKLLEDWATWKKQRQPLVALPPPQRLLSIR